MIVPASVAAARARAAAPALMTLALTCVGGGGIGMEGADGGLNKEPMKSEPMAVD